MAKRRGSKQKKKGRDSKDFNGLVESWLDFSKEINDKMMRLTKEGTREYEELFKIWSEYAKKMTERLIEFKPDDKGSFKDLQNVWTDYSGKMGKRFVELVSRDDSPYRELYQLYSEYSGRMGEYLSGLMSERLKEHNDLYELWMDAFGMDGSDHFKGLSGAMSDIGSSWLETWERSKNMLASGSSSVDYTKGFKEMNELWTETYSKAIMDVLRSRTFAEFSGAMLERNLDFRRMNEQFANQYLGAMGLPTKESVDDVIRKLHELDRKVSEISRRIGKVKGTNR